MRALAQSFGDRYFEQLLTNFSTLEALFGPISIRALEQDQFTWVVTGTFIDDERFDLTGSRAAFELARFVAGDANHNRVGCRRAHLYDISDALENALEARVWAR